MAKFFLSLLFVSLYLSADRNYWVAQVEGMKSTPKFAGRQIPKSVLKKAEDRIYETECEQALKTWIIYLRAAVLIELQKSLIDNEQDVSQRKQAKKTLSRFENTFEKIEQVAERGHQAALSGQVEKSRECYQVAQAYLDYDMRQEVPHESVTLANLAPFSYSDVKTFGDICTWQKH